MNLVNNNMKNKFIKEFFYEDDSKYDEPLKDNKDSKYESYIKNNLQTFDLVSNPGFSNATLTHNID